MAPLQAGQSGEESALLFVQQTIEENPGRLSIILRALLRLPSGPLLLPSLSLSRTVEIAALQLPAIEPAPLRQLPQSVLGWHLNDRIEFVGEVSRRSIAHQHRRHVQ